MARVQNKMLEDQGLDQTEANRSALVWASRAAWEIYMCLLYAEIEHYRAVSQKHPHITYAPLIAISSRIRPSLNISRAYAT